MRQLAHNLPRAAAVALAALLHTNTLAQDRQGAPTVPISGEGSAFVVLDRPCLQEAGLRHGMLSKEVFGLPAELYLNAIDRKLERTYGLYQPRSEDGIAPGGRVTLEMVLDADGGLCGYRDLTPGVHPGVVEAAVRHLQASAPFPPLPPNVSERLDAAHIIQSWAYAARVTSEAARHRLQLYGAGGTHSRDGGARYELAIPLP
ncbi:MAG: hypothetical protein PVF91_07555 [Chromatiales bacterium]|jgi:hypothetical protein